MTNIRVLVESIKAEIEERKALGHFNHKKALNNDNAKSVKKHLENEGYTVREWIMPDDRGDTYSRLDISWDALPVLKSASRFRITDRTFREVMGNGFVYAVPPFQRDYSWRRRQVSDLWDDLAALAGGEEASHYMGHLMLRQDGPTRYTVIDGQQRLATMSVFVLAAISRLGELGDAPRAERLRSAFVSVRDIVSLREENKLVLNPNNRFCYKCIARLEKPPVKYARASDKLLWDALAFFTERFRGAEFPNGESVAARVEKMADGMFFTDIYVEGEANAYNIFETLNARGSRLSAPDLVKSFLFQRAVHGEDDFPAGALSDLEEQWGIVGAQLGGREFPEFMAAEWNSRNEYVPESRVFPAVRRSIGDSEAAREYLEILRRQSAVYSALHDSDDELWQGFADAKKIRADLRALRVFELTHAHGILMAAHEKWDGGDFASLSRWLAALCLRRNAVCGRPAHEMRMSFNRICLDIRGGEKPSAVKKALLEMEPDDEVFRTAFSRLSFSAAEMKRARWLLARIEEKAGGRPVDDAALTVEHVLPKKPDAEWAGAFGEKWEEHVARLGNMALAAKSDNMGQESFEEKRAKMRGSDYETTRWVAEADAWDADEVRSRQNRLAKIACGVWKIPGPG